MIQVTDKFGEYVAGIARQHRESPQYNKHEPWNLLYRAGRVEHFATQREAKAEARKSWPACTFSKR